MKKGFRVLLLAIVILALYGGFSTQVWSYSIGMIAISFLCFIGTLTSKRSGNSSKKGDISSSVIVASVTSNDSSGNDCGSSGGDC